MGMTAAHRFIPLGTLVRVTDQATGRSVVVRVNDREPPHGRRVIDLAEGAAMALGIHSAGYARVRISELGQAAGADGEPTEVAEVPDREAATAPLPVMHVYGHRRAAARRRH
jgi:rare lipoprotein A